MRATGGVGTPRDAEPSTFAAAESSSMEAAVSAPRFSATSNAIDVTNRIPDYRLDPLRAEGYEIIRWATSFGIAAVHGIRIDGGRLSGGADPGHDGVALGV